MFEGNSEKYISSPYESRRNVDFYLSAKEIQEKRGEDLARRLYNFRKSLKDSSYMSSPITSSSEGSLDLEVKRTEISKSLMASYNSGKSNCTLALFLAV